MLQSRAVRAFWMGRAGRQPMASERFGKPSPCPAVPRKPGSGLVGPPGAAQALVVLRPVACPPPRATPHSAQGLHSGGLTRDADPDSQAGRCVSAQTPSPRVSAPPRAVRCPPRSCPSVPGPAPRSCFLAPPHAEGAHLVLWTRGQWPCRSPASCRPQVASLL